MERSGHGERTAVNYAGWQAIDVHESQFACRGISTAMYRDIAQLQGRMVGVPYAEGLDVGRMVLA